MKSRVAFYCAAVIALVLFLASTSHATERRDPVVNPELPQPVSSHVADSVKPAQSHHAKRNVHPSSGAKAHGQAGLAAKKNADSGVGTAGNGK